ncbi:MAG: DNA-methyltransferase [Bosea sp. (in: a-proteobacteria)]
MITREEQIGSCRLILADCLEVMPSLDGVDHVITDPPYEAHMHAAKRGRKTAHGSARRIRTDGHANPKPLDFASIEGIRGEAARQMARLSTGWLLAFCTPEGIAPWRDAIEGAGAKYKRACVWHKPDSAPQFNGQGPAMAVEAFVAAWCGTGFASWNGGGKRNLWSYPTNASDRDGAHPTEKPVALMAALVNDFTKPSQVVLDPFMGSGTTGVACARMGRSFVGIERDPTYFDAACRRIAAAVSQPDLFRSREKFPDQVDLFQGEAA